MEHTKQVRDFVMEHTKQVRLVCVGMCPELKTGTSTEVFIDWPVCQLV